MSEQSMLDSVLWHLRSWEQIKATSMFTLSNYFTFFLLVIVVILSILQARAKAKAVTALPKHDALDTPGFPPIEPLEDFDWKTTEPLKNRPFKPKYHLTMALETLPPSELLTMDKTYKARIHLRRQVIKDHHDVVIGVNDEPYIRSAVCEYYTFLTGTYLPTRFPSMFKIHRTEWEDRKAAMLENIVTGEVIPTTPSATKPVTSILETLGQHIDEDFLFLLPNQGADKDHDNSYVLEAYVCCFPSGFYTPEKLGRKLRDIHAPVPGYKEKLEASMDRFFGKIEVGKYVKRTNWAVTTGAGLFAANGHTHAREGEQVEELDHLEIEKVSSFALLGSPSWAYSGEGTRLLITKGQTLLRSERQTLHRLPRSKALVFGFKTYTYPIQEIKDEGSGEELAQAIDGLKEGSVPAMHFYKRGAFWGKEVQKFLRS